MIVLVSAIALAGGQGLHAFGVSVDGASIHTKSDRLYGVESVAGTYQMYAGKRFGFLGSVSFGGVVGAKEDKVRGDIGPLYKTQFASDVRFQLAYASPLEKPWSTVIGIGWHTDLLLLDAPELRRFFHAAGGVGLSANVWRSVSDRVRIGVNGAFDVDFIDFYNGGDLKVSYSWTTSLMVAFRTGGN